MKSVKGYTYRLTAKIKLISTNVEEKKTMKKSLIAGAGVAALAMAAVPFVGVFATAEVSNTLTDHIKVTVPASCSITNDNADPDGPVADLDNYYAKTINNGEYEIIDASDTDPQAATAADNEIGVSCNVQSGASAGWRLTAVGDGASGHETELYASAINKSIESGQTPVTQADPNADSDWSFRVVIGSPASAAAGFTSNVFTQIPESEMDVATGTGNATAGTFTIDYGVYVDGTQEAGTYEGAVTYTLYNPAS